jgi:hypothetical protein
MSTFSDLKRSVDRLDQYVGFAAEAISAYRKRMVRKLAGRVVDLQRFKPEVIKSYNIAMREFIEERFTFLSEIGTSPMWEDMKSRGVPVKVTKGGGQRNSLPENAQSFGLASEYLIKQIFDALLSDKGVSPGFKMVVKIAANNQVDWDYEVRTDNFYRIKFRKRRVPYPQFLDDLLKGDVPYVSTDPRTGKGPRRYNAYGAFSFGLLGMTPSESEMIDVNAKMVFLRIIAAASRTLRRR